MVDTEVSIPMRTKRSLSLLSVTLALAACSTGGGAATGSATSPTSNPVSVGTLTPSAVVATPTPPPNTSPSAEPSPSPAGGGASAPPVALDPCSLLTADEASTTMGMKLGAGVSTSLDPGRVCTFKSGTSELRLILAPKAPDAATAKAYWDEERAQVPSEVKVTDLPDFDRAAYGSASVAGQSLSALFVIDGTQFFDLYCGFPACDQTKSLAAARLIAGRLP
jgi:hypothetical protein